MEQFLALISSFPTAPLTVAMGVVLLYWLFVIIGVVGHDVLDGASGGVKAAGESVAGAAKAIAGAKGATEAHDVDGGLFSVLGLGKIPVTITASSIVFFAWLGSLFARGFTGDGALVGTGVLAACLVLAVLVSAVALRPLAKVFEPARVVSRRDVVGHICTISSTCVTAQFGTATLADGGAGLLLNVVCSKDNTLRDGDRAVVLQWDEGTQAFEVEPVDWLSPRELEALNDASTAASVISSRVKVR